MRTFIHIKDKEGHFWDEYELVEKDEGYSLEYFYEIDSRAEELEEQGVKCQVWDIEETKEKSPYIYTLIQVLRFCERIDCGCCNPPWIGKETFDELIEVVSEYLDRKKLTS